MDARQTIPSIFGVHKALIGMIHVQALPGAPRSELSVDQICQRALSDATQLAAAGFHGLMIENMHDRPYLKREPGPEVAAVMTAVGREVRHKTGLPLGVQLLAGANRAAVAVALAAGADFIRAEGFVFSHVADEGVMQSDAGELARYRRGMGAERVRIFADIKKKHASHAITEDIDLVETALAAEFFLADGVIVTGTATGCSAEPVEVEKVSQAVQIPTLVGSGITPQNLTDFQSADAFIVGSFLKEDGVWSNPLDAERLAAMLEAFKALA